MSSIILQDYVNTYQIYSLNIPITDIQYRFIHETPMRGLSGLLANQPTNRTPKPRPCLTLTSLGRMPLPLPGGIRHNQPLLPVCHLYIQWKQRSAHAFWHFSYFTCSSVHTLGWPFNTRRDTVPDIFISFMSLLDVHHCLFRKSSKPSPSCTSQPCQSPSAC